jgi:uncharacterized protein YjbJ (UPF0337 family)
MDSDHIEDSANKTGDNIQDKVQETVGHVAGDHASGAERVAGQIAGAGQDLYGQAKDQLRNAAGQVEQIRDYPLSALLLAGVAGFVAGVLFRRA